MTDLKKQIELVIDGHTVSVDVNWQVIATVEQVFGTIADLVASDVLVYSPLRYQVADVICQWVKSRDLRENEIREYVMTCGHDDLNVFIGAIQGAVLYSLNYIEEDEFDRLTKGQDLPKKKSPSPGSASSSDAEPQNEVG